MELVTYSYTNQGGRDNNEDYISYHCDEDKSVWALADGLGGHDCGEVASRLAATMMIEEIGSLKNVSESGLLEVINKTNKAILEEQKKTGNNGIKTTIVCAFIRENYFCHFNVGDSRMYYFKNGCVYKQSKDHSVSQVAVDMGEISSSDIRFNEDRNKLLKVLGDKEDLGILKIDEKIPIEAGDAFLLCSDGFWEYVYETEMEIDLLKSNSPRQWIEFMVKRILLSAPEDNDNFSAVGCFITT